MNQTVKIILTAVVAAMLVAAAVAVKLIWFPSAKDEWFQPNQQRLRQVPTGFVIVRPTHFSKSPTNGFFRIQARMVGRNVTFSRMMAAAYNYDPVHVYVPPSAPQNNFDFLVTTSSDPAGHLRDAVLKKTGYKADVEMHDADVLALKVADATLPGMKVSDDGEKQGSSFKNGRLYLTHMKMADILNPMGDILKTPVVDETGLTNAYDFSVAMDPRKGPNQFDRAALDKILADWGLEFEPDTTSIKMLVVKKAN